MPISSTKSKIVLLPHTLAHASSNYSHSKMFCCNPYRRGELLNIPSHFPFINKFGTKNIFSVHSLYASCFETTLSQLEHGKFFLFEPCRLNSWRFKSDFHCNLSPHRSNLMSLINIFNKSKLVLLPQWYSFSCLFKLFSFENVLLQSLQTWSTGNLTRC